MENEQKGYVYILTNPAFKEDWVKIGKSSRPVNVRSKELDNTAVPLPFEIYATMQTSKYHEVEKLVHKTIDRLTDLRIRQNREFFNVPPQVALDIFRDIASTIDDAVIEVFSADTAHQPHAPKHAKKSQPKEHLFFCKQSGCDAKGVLVDDGFMVHAGSALRVGARSSAKPLFIEQRKQFIEQHCNIINGVPVTRENYKFTSPSVAAAMFIGGNANGWSEWKDANGKTLSEVYRQK